MKIAIVLGTRPEIIKLSKIIKLLRKSEKNYILIHTGQHYSNNLSSNLFKELKLPNPEYNLKISKGTREDQIKKMKTKLIEVYEKEKPCVVIVQGDTNSVLAGALAAKEKNIKIAHIEAGIRSFDLNMPEELNRIETDKISDFCFAPTDIAVKNLKREGINTRKIYLVGNTIVEVTKENLILSEKSKILKKLNLKKNNYIVVTVHRAENVDNVKKLKKLIRVLKFINYPIVIPLHPRTQKNLEGAGIFDQLNQIEKVILTPPLGYLDFLKLCAKSKIILTDSGGIQEECTIYKKPVIILRENTERPEILGKLGWLTGFNINKIIKVLNFIESRVIQREFSEDCKKIFGDGNTSRRIIEIIEGIN